MAKLEQFPEETGKKDRTEDDNFIEEQAASEDSGSFFDAEWPDMTGQPESVLGNGP